MADTGAILPGLGSNEDRDGKNAWSDPTNIQAEANHADCTLPKNDYGDWLRASQFGFSIPSEATIDGIKVEISHLGAHENRVKDSSLRLVDGDGNNVGDDKASAVAWDALAQETFTYGGDSDKWNASPTPSMVNDSDFGVRLSAQESSSAGNTIADVHWIKITVYYTEGVADDHNRSAFFPFM